MKIENIDIQATIEKAQAVIYQDEHMSSATKSMFEVLILIIGLLANRINLNSTNSSKPPSSDPNRKKKPKPKSGRNKGGQKDHVGTTLKKVDDPDIIEPMKAAAVAHADETGINMSGDRFWLHCVSNDFWTFYYPHEKRGTEAFEAIGVLPGLRGILCHDHWKPYYKLDCIHALCNGHHLRELTRAWEQDDQQWAQDMKDLLEKINAKVNRCRIKKSKSRNLLERLRDFEDDVLRFMENEQVAFSNNLGENGIRMTKVQQKISGCFRSIEGAKIFCRIRSYLSTCRKQGIKASHALDLLFNGKL